MKKVLALILGLGFLGFGVFTVWLYLSLMWPVSNGSGEEIVDIPPGTAFSKLAHSLEERGLVSSARLFSLYARMTGQSQKIQMGEYEVRRDMSPHDILNVITSGKTRLYKLTIPEGYNIFEISEILDRSWAGRGREFLELVRDPVTVHAMLGEPAASLEGYLFPETYAVSKYMPVRQLLRMMVDKFKQVYAELASEADGMGAAKAMSRQQIVTFASVVEKETGASTERPLIASVFYNRLKKGMRLQSDPTIIYGIWSETGSYLKNIRKSDILHPTPYNTYTVKALPAGPICNPGREALAAVLHPAKSEYLYFVSRNDGTHIFSETYKQHEKAVRDFQINRRARQGKSWRDLKKKGSHR